MFADSSCGGAIGRRLRGIAPERFENVHAPVGLEIGALTPEEIAISITAELIAVRRGATGVTHMAVSPQKAVKVSTP